MKFWIEMLDWVNRSTKNITNKDVMIIGKLNLIFMKMIIKKILLNKMFLKFERKKSKRLLGIASELVLTLAWSLSETSSFFLFKLSGLVSLISNEVKLCDVDSWLD